MLNLKQNFKLDVRSKTIPNCLFFAYVNLPKNEHKAMYDLFILTTLLLCFIIFLIEKYSKKNLFFSIIRNFETSIFWQIIIRVEEARLLFE